MFTGIEQANLSYEIDIFMFYLRFFGEQVDSQLFENTKRGIVAFSLEFHETSARQRMNFKDNYPTERNSFLIFTHPPKILFH